MKQMTNDEMFIEAVARINRYLVIMGIFFLGYFLFMTKVNIFLFFLAMSMMVYALLSYKHLEITNRLAVELRRSRTALKDATMEAHERYSA